MGGRRAGAGLVVALALGGCAPLVAEAPPTSTIRELTVRDVLEAPAERAPFVSSGECDMLWPVDGTLSSPFGAHDGRNHDHEGIDVAVAEDTPVRAACDGIVTYAGNGLRGYGNVVIVQHAGGLFTLYAHNHRLEVRVGDPVARGQEIARSGQTGHATAPHLHFEVRLGSIARDPLGYLSRR